MATRAWRSRAVVVGLGAVLFAYQLGGMAMPVSAEPADPVPAPTPIVVPELTKTFAEATREVPVTLPAASPTEPQGEKAPPAPAPAAAPAEPTPVTEAVPPVAPPAPACTTTYTGPSGDWTVAGSWDNGIPGVSSVGCIPAGKTVTSSTTSSILGLVVGGTLTQSAGVLTVTSASTATASTVSGTLNLTGTANVLVAGGLAIAAAGTVSTAAGALTRAADAFGAGTTSGNAVFVTHALSYTGAGASSFLVPESAVTVTGDMAAGQVLTVRGTDTCAGNFGGSATLAGSATWAGAVHLTLVGACGGGNPSLIVPGGATLTSTGSITADGDAGPHTISGTVVSSGAVVQSAGSLAVSGSFTAGGPFTVAAAASVTVPAGSTFTNSAGGALAVTGSFVDSGAFVQGAGTVDATKQPVQVRGSLTFTGAGASAFLVPEAAVTVTGNMVAGQVLTVRGTDNCAGNFGGSATLSASATWAGVVHLTRVGTCGGGIPSLVTGAGATLTSTGSIVVDGDAGQHAIDGTVLSSGSVAVAASVSLVVSGSFTANGAFTVATAASVTMPAGSTFTNGAGGALAVTGSFVDSGAFVQGVGTVDVAKQPVQVRGSLTFTGTGASAFLVPEAAVTVTGNMAAGQILTVRGTDACAGNFPGTATLTASATWAGTVHLNHVSTCGGGTSSLVAAPGATLTSTGTILGDGDPAPAARAITGQVRNHGTISLLTGTTRLTGGVNPGDLVNLGSFSVAAAATFGANAGSTFTNGLASATGPTGTPVTVANAGAWASQGAVIQGAGTTTGTALLVGGSLQYTGPGASSYTVPPNSAIALSGDLVDGQVLTINGQDACAGNFPATATAAASFRSGGDILLRHSSTCGNGLPSLVIPAGSTLVTTASGSISATGEGGPHQIAGDITTAGPVSVDIGTLSFVTPGSAWHVAGDLTVASGTTLDIGDVGFFVDAGARIQNTGTLTSTAAVTQGDGVAPGVGQTVPGLAGPFNDLQITGGSIRYTGAGVSAWAVQPNKQATLLGAIQSAQRLTIVGRDACAGNFPATVTTGEDVSSAGTVELIHESTCGGGLPTLAVAPGTTFSNAGTILLDGGGSDPTSPPHRVTGAVVNTGVIHAVTGLTTFAAGSLTTSGSVLVDSTAGIVVANDASVANLAGAIALSGPFTTAGTFHQSGGTTAGALPVTVTGTLRFTGDGPSSFLVPAGAAANLAGDPAIGQHLTIEGRDACAGNIPGVAIAEAAFTNRGTITIHHVSSCGGGLAELRLPAGAAVTNAGTIESRTEGGPTQLTGDVVNLLGASFTTEAATFTITGSLRNAGHLQVGPTAQLHGASFTQDPTGELAVAVTGASNSGTTSRLAFTGAAALDGFLNVVADDNAATTSPDIFLTHASRTGTFRRIRGQRSPTEAYAVQYAADHESLVLAPSDLHVSLVASGVTVTQTSVGPGQLITAHATVTSDGPDLAPSPWNDSFYLSQDGVYDPSDILLGRVARNADLAAHASYQVNLSTFLPPATPGTYRVVVVPDSAGRVSFAALNTPAGSSTFQVTPPPLLVPGTPIIVSIAAGQDAYYGVLIGGTQDVRVALATTSGKVELFASPGVFPTVAMHAKSAAAGSFLTASQSAPGTWYLVLHGNASAGAVPGTSATLTASLPGLTATSITPASGANKGPTTIGIVGSNLRADLVATLTRGATSITGTNLRRNDSTEAFATFDLLGAPIGSYDLHLVSGVSNVTLPAVFAVTNGPGGHLQLGTSAPYSLRFGWAGNVQVTLTNTGGTDVAVPVVRLSARANSVVANVGRDVFGPSADIVDPDLSSPGHPLPHAVLPAGQTVTLEFQVKSVSTVAHAILETEAQAVNDGDATPINWVNQLATAKPESLSSASWTSVVNAVAAVGGATEADWAHAAVTTINEARGFGVTFGSEAELLDYLVQRALATSPSAPVSGRLVSGDPAAPLGRVDLQLSSLGAQQTAKSWYDGRFAFFDVPAGAATVVVPGHIPHPAASCTAPCSFGDVAVADGATLLGHVTRFDTGAAVSGATVVATDRDGRLVSELTGADGSYRIDGLVPGTVTVAAGADALITPADANVTVSAASPTTFDMALGPGAVISGRITVGGASPPAGTSVQAVDTTTRAATQGTVAADGSYVIDGLRAGSYDVVASGPGRAPATAAVTVAAQATSSGHNLALPAGISASGVVTDADTLGPLAGVIVTTDAVGKGGASATSDATGHWTLTGLPTGAQALHFRDPSGAHLSASAPITVAASPVTANIALSPFGSATIRARSVSGVNIAGAQILLVAPGPGGDPSAAVANMLNAGDLGGVTATGLRPGVYDAQVVGSEVHHPFTIGVGTRNLDFTMDVPVAHLHGKVVTSTALPLADALVRLVDATGAFTTATTLADGSYSFPITRDQTVDVVVADPGTGIVRINNVLAKTTADTAVANLVAGASGLTVNVDDGTTPIAEAQVQLEQGTGRGLSAIRTPTSAAGVAVFPRLKPGSYVLTVSERGHAPSRTVITVAAAAGTRTVHLGAGGSLTGTVVDGGGQVVPFARVVAVDPATQLQTDTFADASGSYTVPGLLPGATYGVSFSAAGLAPAVVTGAHPGATVDATLQTAGHAVVATLSPAAAGGPFKGGSASLLDATGTIVASQALGAARTAADRTATATFTPVAPGTYTLRWSAAGTSIVDVPVVMGAADVAVPVTSAPGSALPAENLALSPRAHVVPSAEQAQILGLPSVGELTKTIYDWLVGGLDVSPPDPSVIQDVLFARIGPALARHSYSECPPVPELMIKVILGRDEVRNALATAQSEYADALQAQKDQLLDFAVKAAGVFGGLIAAVAAAFGPGELALAYEGLSIAKAANLTKLLEALGIANNVSSYWGAAQAVGSLFMSAFEAVVKGVTSPNGNLSFTGILGILGNMASTMSGLPSTGSLPTLSSGNLTKLGDKVSGVIGKGANFLNQLLGIIALGESFQDLLATAKDNLQALNVGLDLYEKALRRLAGNLGALERAPVKLPNPNCDPPPPPPPPPPPDPPPPPPGPHDHIDNHLPGDPNDIAGPAGVGSPRWVRDGSAMPYVVHFENDPLIADAPAVLVVVTEQVPSSIDPTSVQLTGFGFGSTIRSVPAGQRAFSMRLDLRSTIGDFVDAVGSFDPTTSTITWTLSTIDPITGDLDTLPTAGFLPVNDAAGNGEGYVTWTGRAKTGLVSGTVIPAQASIVFDRNAPIATPVWSNTIDAAAPTAHITPLAARTAAGNLPVAWSGNDGTGSGVATYDVYVSVDGGPLTIWRPATTGTTGQYPTTAGHTYGFAVAAVDLAGNAGAAPGVAEVTTTAAGFAALAAPARLMDTRSSPTIDGLFSNTGPLAAGSVTQLQVGGRAGIPTNASAVTLNVTVVSPGAGGYVTVWPCGQTQPLASNLNFAPGDIIPNAVITSVGSTGKVCFFTSALTGLIVDVSGTLATTAFTPLAAPARLMDTRSSPTIDGLFSNTGPLAAGSVTQLQVGGRAGIAAGASAVTLNVTVVSPAAGGYVTVWPCGQTQPLASNLNFGPGDIIPNAVVTSVGTAGKVCFFTSAVTGLLVDVSGTLAPTAFSALAAPARLMDTRNSPTIDGLFSNTGPLAAGSVTQLQVGGRAGIAAGASAVTLNVTVVGPVAGGYVTVWPCGQTQPLASNLNFVPGDVIPNLVITSVGTGGKVCLFTSAGTGMIVDVSGTLS
jgi:hypothetical protein